MLILLIACYQHMTTNPFKKGELENENDMGKVF